MAVNVRLVGETCMLHGSVMVRVAGMLCEETRLVVTASCTVSCIVHFDEREK
jgi:hypothetical protein